MCTSYCARGVFVRKPGAPPLDRLHPRHGRHAGGARGLLRAVLAAALAAMRRARDGRACRVRDPLRRSRRISNRSTPRWRCSIRADDAAVPGRHRRLRARIRTSASRRSASAPRRPSWATTTSPRSITSGSSISTRRRETALRLDAERADRRERRAGYRRSATSTASPSICWSTARRSTTSTTSSTTSKPRRAFEATDAPLIFIGHSHVAEYYALAPDGTIRHGTCSRAETLALEAGRRATSSTSAASGQPRDANPLPSFAFYDPDARDRDVAALSVRRRRACARRSTRRISRTCWPTGCWWADSERLRRSSRSRCVRRAAAVLSRSARRRCRALRRRAGAGRDDYANFAFTAAADGGLKHFYDARFSDAQADFRRR